MASSLASDKPSLPAPSAAIHDPFVTSTPAPAHHRYSNNFDHDLFIAGPASSPRQAKRALEAHLAETERRLEEAGKLGTALVTQRKTLTEQLQEVDKLQAQGELNPELRQKLVEIEKEYNNLARESARAFLPKQRVPSNEANPNSPFAPESRSGRRSVSPSKFESQATGSPTKLSVPNRKIRNQPSNRVHDIEFAAEISTSLIAQVRNLQALLSERDEEVKDLKVDTSRLEIESENFQQRAKTLDESENRYKEENWNLETKLQELTTQQKEAADREKRLTQALNVTKSEKVTAQRELDEVKVTHARLVEEHSAAVRNHDIELGTAKRKIGMAEGERAAMQRRIDDLTGQNQELARAFSTQRARVVSMESNPRPSDDDFESAGDQVTPEHSPPQSPIKGTPRHAMLETETMKSSLSHAQRTIQSQRGLLHREKTEKLELRRIIQDLRDDLEKVRTEASETRSAKKNRKTESKEFKKPPRLLGSFRSSRQEVIHDDPEWEDQGDISPRATSSPLTGSTITVRPQAGDSFPPTDASEHFDTANENSESAFETANERGTETEDFQTGNEEFSGSEDAETETEGNSRGFGRMRKPPALPSGLARRASRRSFHSTASTSADEDDFPHHLMTPTGTISSQRSNRFRLSRGIFNRSSRQASEEPNLQSSPASFASSAGGTPQGGQSLFAELQDFDGSDDESVGANSPSRRGTRSTTPGSVGHPFSPPPPMPALPKVVMVDSGVMTEPVVFVTSQNGVETLPLINTGLTVGRHDESMPASPVSVIALERAVSMESVVDASDERAGPSWPVADLVDNSRPVSMSYSDAGAQHDPDMERKLALFPAPPKLSPILPPILSMSAMAFENVEPREEAIDSPTPPALSLTSISNESVEPVAESEIPPPNLSLTAIIVETLEPVAEPEIPPNLSLTTIVVEHLEPVSEPQTPLPELTLSSIAAHNLEPVAEPEIPPPDLSLSIIFAEGLEPQAELEIPPAELSFSGIIAENLEPVAEPEVPPAGLSLSVILGENVEPVAEPEKPLPELSLTTISTEELKPVAEPETPLPELTLTTVVAEQLVPVAEPESPLPELSFARIAAEELEPLAEPQTPPPALTFTSVHTEIVEPLPEPDVPAAALSLSTICGESVEPVVEPGVLPLVVLPPRPSLTMSEILREHVEPTVIKAPQLTMSSILTEHVEPIAEPEVVIPPAPELSMSVISGEHVEPIVAPEIIIPPAPTLSLSTILGEHVQPIAEPEVIIPPSPELSMSIISGEHVEPIAEPEIIIPPAPQLSLSTILGEHVEPIAEPEPILPERPELTVTSIRGEDIEPTPLEAPDLALSSIAMEQVEPVLEVEKVVLPPSLNISSIYTEHWEPREMPESIPTPVNLAYSQLSTEQIEPLSEPEPIAPSLALSSIAMENVKPVLEPLPPLPTLFMSSIATEGVEPISPVHKKLSTSSFGFSAINSIETQPVSPRSPWRDGFVLPRDMGSPFAERESPETPTSKSVGLGIGRGKHGDSPPIIAEDETRQSPRDTPEAETPESQRPFREISTNTNARPSRKPLVDQSAQTALTADVIDAMFKAKSRLTFNAEKNPFDFDTPGTTGTSGTVRIRRSQESFGSPTRNKGKMVEGGFEASPIRRPGSSASGRASIFETPPLPSNHRQAIEAARSGSSHGTQSNMGPPLWPASVLKQRPVTPNQPLSPLTARGTPTPRAVRNGAYGNAEVHSPAKLNDISRKSSVSSFASELESRFNMRPSEIGLDPAGFGPNTDPRMIQAITQTMIGEYLWKYTRKTGRGEMSENRHRRYFWVHPYTRTLYWSDRDPSTAGRSELKAKSVPIEAVRVVTDDNPMPPGLHRKSLVIISPGRTIKFTCTTGQRHETWFNALSYLLLRTNNDAQSDLDEMGGNITREDVEEFNPQVGPRVTNGTPSRRVPPSLSSYNSRTTRNESPAVGMSMNIPTLTPKPIRQRPSIGTLSKLSGYWKGSQLSGTFSTRRGRGVSGQDVNIYEASEAHDSAEDLREIIERQDRESARLENVRACCDGKHDVGTLPHLSSKRGRPNHHQSYQGITTPMASMRSRA
ncbi:Anucleate primary sterigmata protein A [Neonectria ditissima]|uniref:Anucleate primary sterigmata protein A n=1 Tax=Neonectria ditissima TaxID=78410 RepID=A0A0N8H586_9HYPO|nr:Anucleate primary sterigmata protein A [Neonectria ditissima]